MNTEEISYLRSSILDGVLDSILEALSVDDNSDLYHYTSPNGLLGIFENNEMWFGNILDLNDITEIEYAFNNVVVPVLSDSKIISDENKDLLFKKLNMARQYKLFLPHKDSAQLHNSNVFIFSTSLNGNSHNLWNNYTKTSNRAGYAISLTLKDWHDAFWTGLNMREKSTTNEVDSFLLGGKVIYKLSDQKKLVEKFLDPIPEKTDGRGKEFIDVLFDIVAQGLFILAIYMKDIDYVQESEYRFVAVVADEVATVNKKESPHIKFVNVDGSIVSRLAMPIDISKFRKIVISPYMPEQSHTYNDLRFFLSRYGITDFDIVSDIKRKSR